jgi:uncharacterized protein (UPF0276 family)
MTDRTTVPDLGVGVGLRVPHYRGVLERRPPVDFFEIISENFMVPGGKPRHHLERVLDAYRVVQHGVSLDIGGPQGPSPEYLQRLKALARETRTPWVSDHFCWCGSSGVHLHDLLPLPYTEEAILRVADRAHAVQDHLELPFALENTSSYLTYRSSAMPEWEFLTEVTERADIGLLLDVNNIYVSSYNHGLDPIEFLKGIPAHRVVQIHVAGHTHVGEYIIDTHRGPILPPVWDLYRLAIELVGSVSTLIEWDDAIPELDVLLAEAERARSERDRALEARARGETSVDPEAVRDALRVLRGQPAVRGPGWVQGGPRESAGKESDHEAA